MTTERQLIEILGNRLHYQTLGTDSNATPLVFLHEGLGSVELWRDFPARVAAVTGHPAIVYSRRGYGHSDVMGRPWPADYMHHEALDVLPALLGALVDRPPILIGHSDGASISLIHAGAGHPVQGMVLIAPHVFTEKAGLESIRRSYEGFPGSGLAERMAKYHTDPEATFRGWAEAWLAPDFESFNIEGYLPGVRCPILLVQCSEDEYGSLSQLGAIEAQVSGPVQRLVLPGSSHSPHLIDMDAVVVQTARLIESVTSPIREA